MTTISTQVRGFNPESSETSDSYHSHNQLGLHGENYVANLLRNAGYLVRYCANERFSGDLCITCPETGEIFKLEVKTAIESYHGRYGFCLYKAGFTDYRHSQYVALLCIDKNGSHYLYLIPAVCLNGQFIAITSHPSRYRGKYAPFRVHGQISLSECQKTAELWGMK